MSPRHSLPNLASQCSKPRRKNSSEDRREHKLVLTEKGRASLRWSDPHFEETALKIFRPMPMDRLKTCGFSQKLVIAHHIGDDEEMRTQFAHVTPRLTLFLSRPEHYLRTPARLCRNKILLSWYCSRSCDSCGVSYLTAFPLHR